MRIKLLPILLIFAVLFSFNLVIACPGGDSQLILKLSSETNAHGSLYNQSYSNEVCYDSLFGRFYSGASPHLCSGTNRVLKLSSATNAHAEIPSLNNYLTDVCYGNLVCSAKTNCSQGETLIVSLSSNTNAHLSSTSSYPVKICCSSVDEAIGKLWANMQGSQITESELGDTVQMIWRNTGLSPGTSVSFEIYEDDAPNDTAIRTGANAITTSVNSNRDAVALWTITQSDLAKTSDYENFVFQVQSQRSNNLEISNIISNSPPQAQIAIQGQTQLFKKNVPVNFTYSAYDEDDTINLVISFGDGQTQTLANSSGKAQHSYLSSGVKKANITATDSRGISATAYTEVFIIQQYLNIFPVISNPEENEQMASKTISFDASSTIAVYCSLEEINMCSVVNPASLGYTWNFSDSTSSSGSQLTKTFSYSGEQSAALLVKFTNSTLSGQASKSINFVIAGCSGMTPGQCSDDGETYCTEDEEILDTSESGEACAGEDEEIGTDDDCCPAGSSCTEDGCSLNWDEECFYLSVCGDYLNEDECKVDPCGLGGFGVGTDVCNSNILGYYVGNCSCFWEDDTCSLTYEAMNLADYKSFSCDKTFEETECIDGQKTIKWTAIPSDSFISPDELNALGCVNSEEIYSCGESSLKMDFSSNISIFILLSLLVVFYVLRLNKN